MSLPPLLLKAFDDRLSATGLAPNAVVGAVMRKLAHLIYGVINSGKPFDVNTPPAKAGGFVLRLQAGLIGHTADDAALIRITH